MGTHFFTSLGSVLQEIESWRPHDCVRELEYRDSLHRKLESAFRKPPVKEYGHGQSRVDIAFGTTIAIELKLDLNKTGKLDRLVGQLMNYAASFGTTVVVLVGETDRALYESLKKKVRSMPGDIKVVLK